MESTTVRIARPAAQLRWLHEADPRRREQLESSMQSLLRGPLRGLYAEGSHWVQQLPSADGLDSSAPYKHQHKSEPEARAAGPQHQRRRQQGGQDAQDVPDISKYWRDEPRR